MITTLGGDGSAVVRESDSEVVSTPVLLDHITRYYVARRAATPRPSRSRLDAYVGVNLYPGRSHDELLAGLAELGDTVEFECILA